MLFISSHWIYFTAPIVTAADTSLIWSRLCIILMHFVQCKKVNVINKRLASDACVIFVIVYMYSRASKGTPVTQNASPKSSGGGGWTKIRKLGEQSLNLVS